MISVVILTWNSAPYIEKSLKSLTEDAYRADLPIKIFVVDGGYTDGALEIWRRLAREITGL